MRIGRTFRFRKHVGNTHTFKNGTHSTTGLYSGTRRSGLDIYESSTEFCQLIVRDSTFEHRNFHEIFLSSFHAFGDSRGYFARLTQAPAYDTGFVTYHNNCRKAESTTTLGHFRYTVDSNQTVFQLNVIC